MHFGMSVQTEQSPPFARQFLTQTADALARPGNGLTEDHLPRLLAQFSSPVDLALFLCEPGWRKVIVDYYHGRGGSLAELLINGQVTDAVITDLDQRLASKLSLLSTVARGLSAAATLVDALEEQSGEGDREEEQREATESEDEGEEGAELPVDTRFAELVSRLAAALQAQLRVLVENATAARRQFEIAADELRRALVGKTLAAPLLGRGGAIVVPAGTAIDPFLQHVLPEHLGGLPVHWESEALSERQERLSEATDRLREVGPILQVKQLPDLPSLSDWLAESYATVPLSLDKLALHWVTSQKR